jgi:predicted nucleic acid-binding protein
MGYIDTSVLLAMFLKEPKTADVWGWFEQQAIGATAISHWTLAALAALAQLLLQRDQQGLARLHSRRLIRREADIHKQLAATNGHFLAHYDHTHPSRHPR